MGGLMRSLLCLSVLGCVLAQEGLDRCHTLILTPHHFLNLPRFLGVWYPLKIASSKASQNTPLNYTCFQINLSQSAQENVIDVHETYLELENGVVSGPGEMDGTSVIGEVNPARPIPAIWANHGVYEGQNYTTHAVIVASNEDSWALHYHCGNYGGVLRERLSIWSRRRYLEPAVLKTLDKIAYGIGFPASHFQTIDQSKC